jgi:hypothetical protein
MKQQFLNDPSDVPWLLSTHLKGKWVPPFQSFLLFGDESNPERLELFSVRDPDVGSPHYLVDLTRGD